LGTALTDFSVQLNSGIGEEFGLVAIDPRGLGKSRMTTNGVQFVREYPADFYLQDALDGADKMKTLGYEKYSVIGWSDGANAALHLAANVKDAVKKLVVFGGNSYVTEEDIQAYEAVRDVSNWSERMRSDKSALMVA
jgi:valacyclovir hydrolase